MKRRSQICGVRITSQIAAMTPTTWNTSGQGSRDGMSGTGDDLCRDEPVNLLRCHAELREHLVGVLAEPRRRAADRRGRGGRTCRKSEDAGRTEPGLLEFGNEPEMADLRILEHLVELVDRARGDLALLHPRDPLGG